MIWVLLCLIQEDAKGVEHFEKKVRPLLVERCFECHSAGAKKLKGSLYLDSREGALKGGDTSPAMTPGEPAKSLLLKAVRWVDEGVGVAAFFLDAPDLRQVLRLAREGKTLPQKATYFHPKPPSGMVFDRLERDRRL